LIVNVVQQFEMVSVKCFWMEIMERSNYLFTYSSN